MKDAVFLFGGDEEVVEAVEQGEHEGEVGVQREGVLGEEVAGVEIFFEGGRGEGGEVLGEEEGFEEGLGHGGHGESGGVFVMKLIFY